MKIELKEIPVRKVVDGYVDSAEEGVVGYNGQLNIRPAYQREFIYKDKQRDEVIHTVIRNFPLNVMYWAKNNDNSFEILDGQQRTISVCQYVNDEFSVEIDGMPRKFCNLTKDEQDLILDYSLKIYICDGTEKEKLDWFKIINIAGEKLTDQELRNAVYAGTWTSDAKRYFSKNGCPASNLASDFLKGTSIRQEYLETAILWAASRENKSIEEYMGEHQNEPTAISLWNYFQNVISWIQAIFPKKRKEMKGLPWGLFYNEHSKRNDLNPDFLECEIRKLMGDEDVTKKSGIYEYLLTKDERKLSIREFDKRDKHRAYEKQNHKCALCGEEFDFEDMHADHIKPWSKGGQTIFENCQMLCRDCNLKKGAL